MCVYLSVVSVYVWVCVCEFEKVSSLIICCYGQGVMETYFDSPNGITSESWNSLRPFKTQSYIAEIELFCGTFTPWNLD